MSKNTVRKPRSDVRGATVARGWWSFDDLCTVISREDLVDILGEFKPGDKCSPAWREIEFVCERAKEYVREILGFSAQFDDDGDRRPRNVPVCVNECVVVLAAMWLFTNSKLPDVKEKLQKRFDESKKLVEQLRDKRVMPDNARTVNFGNGVTNG
jgi:hypothetical protein